MAYETDEARDAARRRLQARMERRGAAQPAPQETTVRSPIAPRLTSFADGGKIPREQVTTTHPRQGGIAIPQAPAISPVAAVAAMLLVAVVLVAASLTQCVAVAPADDAVETPDAAGQVPAVTLDLDNAAQARLAGLIGEDGAAKLLGRAFTDADALWIASHADEYGADGVEVQSKLLKLAADEPAAVEYVRLWPAKFPSGKESADKTIAMSASSPSQDVPDTAVPHLYQWDRRWGYTTYSSAPFGLTGCGPTALAMVAQALTGKHDMTPYEMGSIAKKHGYMTEFNGTGREFFVEMADELDLHCEQLYPTGESIRGALEDGAVIVANLGPGQFTDDGHYFVLAGLAGDGSVIVNDPYSVERSSRTWDADTIADESLALFAYTSA